MRKGDDLVSKHAKPNEVLRELTAELEAEKQRMIARMSVVTPYRVVCSSGFVLRGRYGG